MLYSIVYITAADEAEAKRISKVLAEERLAACVNIHPIFSIYRWEGKVEEAEETAVLVKTRIELVEQVIRRIKELHSYQVPDIVSWTIEKGNPEYLQWIQESTEEV